MYFEFAAKTVYLYKLSREVGTTAATANETRAGPHDTRGGFRSMCDQHRCRFTKKKKKIIQRRVKTKGANLMKPYTMDIHVSVVYQYDTNKMTSQTHTPTEALDRVLFRYYLNVLTIIFQNPYALVRMGNVISLTSYLFLFYLYCII